MIRGGAEPNEGTFMRHESCEKCGSSDAKAVYTNGSAYCFSCQTWFPPDDDGSRERRKYSKVKHDTPLIEIQSIQRLKSRGLSQETVEKYNYGIGLYKGEPVQVAPYYNENRQVVAQHIRTKDKQFRWRGNSQGKLELFGQHLWRKNGKRLVITEGEIDCMTIAQVFNNKWATVSVPNGAPSALKYIKQNLEFIEGYDEIVIAFDNDSQGKQASEEVAQILTAGKVKIANFQPFKDANEMLQKGKGSKIAQVIFEAKEYRPDGIVAGTDVTLEELMNEEEIFSFDIPYPRLNDMMKGLRKGEITTLTSGTGMGKTTLAFELGYHLFKNHNQKVATIALEDSLKKSMLKWIALDNDVPAGELFLDRTRLSEEKFEKSFDDVIHSGNLFFYDHFGSLEAENLIAKIKYFAQGLEVDFIIFDHISIAVSGIEGGDERRLIDNLMTKLRSLVEASGVGIILISHLKNPQGNQKSHEEGGRVTANQLRGSGAIKQISDNIIGVERDQQGDDPNVSTLRVLKSRLIGQTGWAGNMFYSHETGRLKDYDPEEPVENSDFENPFLVKEESEEDNDTKPDKQRVVEDGTNGEGEEPDTDIDDELPEGETKESSGDSEPDTPNTGDSSDGGDKEAEDSYPVPY